MPSDQVYVALLRAVNVSGHNPVAMKDLRALFEALPADSVSTYVQSGNVVFRSALRDASSVADAARRLLASRLGLDVAVIVRDTEELSRLVADNPFLRRGRDEARLHATVLAEKPSPGRVASLVDQPPPSGNDEFEVVGTTVYVHCPDGYGRSKLTNGFFEKKLGVAGTTRNWRSLTTLSGMARSLRAAV